MCLQGANMADLSEEEDEEPDDEDLCIMCWEELRKVIFYHCMHMVRSHHSDSLERHPGTLIVLLSLPVLTPMCTEIASERSMCHES